MKKIYQNFTIRRNMELSGFQRMTNSILQDKGYFIHSNIQKVYTDDLITVVYEVRSEDNPKETGILLRLIFRRFENNEFLTFITNETTIINVLRMYFYPNDFK